MSSDTTQTTIDPFREMNRYDDRYKDWPSAAVFEPPRRTLGEYWRKWHADRDCGSDSVRLVERASHSPVSEKYHYKLYCYSCGYEIPETEVLFLGGEWYSNHGWKTAGEALDDLHLPEGRVLSLGPDPDREELERALELTRIEREGKGLVGFAFGHGTWFECDGCGHKTPLTWDERCRMCYGGEWTERMQSDVRALARAVRERNDSFKHRLPTRLDPTEPGAAPLTGTMLWRRHDAEPVSKLVEVVGRYEDLDDGHREYELTDPTCTEYHRYREEDLGDCFWDMGLQNDEAKAVMNDRIREIYQCVCDHSFHEAHDPETHEVTGEECIHCRKQRSVSHD